MKKDEDQILKIIKYTPPLFILIVSIFLTILISMDYKKTLKNEKNTIRENYIKEQKLIINQNVTTAINHIQREFNTTELKLKKRLQIELKNAKAIVSSIYNKNKEIKTKEEITKLIKDALSDIRFNEGRGYFFINNLDGISIFHPIFPKREGTNIYSQKDSKGIIRFQKIKKVIEEHKKGFTTFYFFNPKDKTKQQQKLVYAEYFKPYNWMIGTGEYIKEFEKDIQDKALQQLKDIKLGKNKYYIAMTYDGTFLSHPKKDLIGYNIFKEKRLHRMKPFFNKIKKLIPYGEGYYSFIQSRKPDTGKPAQKIAFMKTFTRWNWIVSTGFYIDDIEKIIEKKESYLDKKYNNYINTVIISSIIITILLLFVSINISKIIEIRFRKYKQRLEGEIKENIKQKNILQKAQEVASIGDWELNVTTMRAYWSDQIIKILGLEKKPEVVGPEFLKSIMHKDDWPLFENSLKNAIEKGSEHRCIYRIFRPNKQMRWIECRGHFNPKKKIVNGVIQDITENKILEEEKLHKEEMLFQQSKMAAMGEMIGNIAHQWRQPLSTISTAATGTKLQKEMGVLTDDELIKSMDSINNTAQYLSQTINDFRNFYKPDGTHSIFFTKDLIEKVLTLIDSQFKTKNIEIIRNIENIEIQSLENELLQVLINILNNAKDALENENILEKLIFINIFTDKKDKSKIHIEILDNAGGIRNDIINRIFEPYFTTKHKSQGTGIGLYMCEEIVSKHLNGKLLAQTDTYNYNNNEYTGAKFKIIINKDID